MLNFGALPVTHEEIQFLYVPTPCLINTSRCWQMTSNNVRLAFTPSVETQNLAYRNSQTARCKQTVATNQNYKRMRVAAVKREKNFFSQWLMILTLLLVTGKVARNSKEWKVKAKNCKRFVVSSGNCTLKSYPYHFFTISGIVLRRADVWYGHVCERPIY